MRATIKKKKISDTERLQNIKKLFFSISLLIFTFIGMKYFILGWLVSLIMAFIGGLVVLSLITEDKWLKIDKSLKYTDILYKIFPDW